jgi:hypothetical protein
MSAESCRWVIGRGATRSESRHSEAVYIRVLISTSITAIIMSRCGVDVDFSFDHSFDVGAGRRRRWFGLLWLLLLLCC